MCGKGGAGVDGVVYEIGDVDVVFGKVGGIDVDVSDVEGVKAVGFEDGASVVGVSEDAAPGEAVSSEGASRVVERGQGRPAMEASRLFSMEINMIIGIDMGKTNGCSDARKPVARHGFKRSRRDGMQEMKNRRQKKVDKTGVRIWSILENKIHRGQPWTIHEQDSLFLFFKCIRCSGENDPLADFVALQSKDEWSRSPRNQGSRMNVVVLAEAPVRAIFI